MSSQTVLNNRDELTNSIKQQKRRLKRKSPAATYFPTNAVSLAQESLTSVFGMGTGITSPLWPPGIINKRETDEHNKSTQVKRIFIRKR